jgi:hypothetical protein
MLLPDISTLKISELKAELHYLYGIDISGLSEKQDLISALKTARETLPSHYYPSRTRATNATCEGRG